VPVYWPGGARPRGGVILVCCSRTEREKASVETVVWGRRLQDGVCFTSFSPAISPEALKAKGSDLRKLRIHRRTDLSLDALARWLNPIVAGWMNYYGRFYRSEMHPLLRRISFDLRRWAGRKYRRLRTLTRFRRWWARVIDRAPDLFAHWRWVRTPDRLVRRAR
jgi:RNA-directed DNA polymerase